MQINTGYLLIYLGPELLEESVELKAPTVDNIKVYTTQIQDLVIARLNAAISCKLMQLVNVLHESYTGNNLFMLSFVPLYVSVCPSVCHKSGVFKVIIC